MTSHNLNGTCFYLNKLREKLDKELDLHVSCKDNYACVYKLENLQQLGHCAAVFMIQHKPMEFLHKNQLLTISVILSNSILHMIGRPWPGRCRWHSRFHVHIAHCMLRCVKLILWSRQKGMKAVHSWNDGGHTEGRPGSWVGLAHDQKRLNCQIFLKRWHLTK